MSDVDKLGKSNWVQTKVTAPATTTYLKMVHAAIDHENASHMAGEHIAMHQTEARGNLQNERVRATRNISRDEVTATPSGRQAFKLPNFLKICRR